MNSTRNTIADMALRGPFCVFDVRSGNYIYQWTGREPAGDLPPDIGVLPVLGLRCVGSDTATVLYIDTEVIA